MLVRLNYLEHPLFGVWIATLVIGLIFLPVFVLQAMGHTKRAKPAPLWAYFVLGIVFPIAIFIIGYSFIYQASKNFDHLIITRDAYLFAHSFTGEKHRVMPTDIEAIYVREVRRGKGPSQQTKTVWLAEIHLSDGIVLESEQKPEGRQELLEGLQKAKLNHLVLIDESVDTESEPGGSGN